MSMSRPATQVSKLKNGSETSKVKAVTWKRRNEGWKEQLGRRFVSPVGKIPPVDESTPVSFHHQAHIFFCTMRRKDFEFSPVPLATLRFNGFGSFAVQPRYLPLFDFKTIHRLCLTFYCRFLAEFSQKLCRRILRIFVRYF